MKITTFLKEVKAEAKRISWSSFSHTRMLTFVVMLISIFTALYLTVVDAIWQKVIDFIIQL